MSAMQNIFSVNSNVHKLEDEKVLLQVSTGKNGIKERKCSECGMNFYSTYECPHKETHIAVTKESTVTETGEESIICSECGTVLEKRIVPRKQSTNGNANQTTSDTASKEGNISEGKQNETEDAALENNMISVPQIGLKSVFTQGPFTQNAVDANDKLTGTLVEKSTGKTFVDANGKTATITQTFTPDSDSGSVDMVFDINPSNLKTSALVAFETLSCNGEQVTIENDLDNEQQTLHFPILSTTAKGKVSGKNYVDIGGDMSIIDTIKYEGVQYGMTHTIKSYLVDKTTGKIVQDDNGNDIVKTTEWEPEATQGSIDVEIPVTGKKLAGRTLVVFEEIYLGDAMIACHKDINDANQTIKVKGYRDCTVIKRIKADDYWKEHGDPTFIFKLTGTDTLGAAHTYYQSVTFTENYVKAHTDSDGYVEMKAVFGQVPAGEYTCSEESVSRFEFESLTKPVNATINGKTAVYHLTDNDTACATFTNKKYEEGDFGHDSVVVNHFNHKTQD